MFSNNFISEKDVRVLLERNANAPHPTYSADFSQPTAREAKADDRDGPSAVDHGPAHSYELVNVSPYQYLCSIPFIESPPTGELQENELAKAEEARERDRATANGWEMVSQIEDSCLYFMSGWWSYSFCKNREIVQFHALASIPSGQVPRRDLHTAAYVLGKVPTIPATAQQQARKESGLSPLPAELQAHGEQRYLVQRLEGGTICDLTGRERTIEVQYHCVPGMPGDRIGWIKEVTICNYVMVINTPRLCNDVAFLPPEETKANPIECQLIVDGDKAEPRLLDAKELLHETWASQAENEKGQQPKQEILVGGLIVGARKVLSGGDEEGKPPLKLTPPQSFFGDLQPAPAQIIEMVAKAASKEEGGKVKLLEAEDLERLDIKPEDLQEMMDRMQRAAGDAGWTMEIVELGGDLRELRGYVDKEEGEEGDEKGKKESKGSQEGSEEKFFKEEL